MNNYQQRQSTKSHAMMQAARTLVRLGIDQSQPIDIFKIIQDEGIWLMFQPLKHLYGFYLNEGKVAGIVINSKHPIQLQRYTAAHEYAHHILKHIESFDDSVYIERADSISNLQELAADTFAAYFLMPEQLVNTLLNRMGLLRIGRPLRGDEIYRLSLDLGASFRATVNHLQTLKKITLEEAENLRQASLQQIKAQVRSQLIKNSWAEGLVLDKSDNGKVLSLRVYENLKISLPENPTTGYIWTFDNSVVEPAEISADIETGLFSQQQALEQSNLNTAVQQEKYYPLELESSDFEVNGFSDSRVIYGGNGTRYFTVRTLLPGHHTLRLLERRPWEDESEAVGEFIVRLEVALQLTRNAEKGFPDFQGGKLNTTQAQENRAA